MCVCVCFIFFFYFIYIHMDCWYLDFFLVIHTHIHTYMRLLIIYLYHVCVYLFTVHCNVYKFFFSFRKWRWALHYISFIATCLCCFLIQNCCYFFCYKLLLSMNDSENIFFSRMFMDQCVCVCLMCINI